MRANRKGNVTVLRRILGILLIVLGLSCAGLGIASATLWRDADFVVATASPAGDGTFAVTEPGVLAMMGPDVTIRATVPSGSVTMVIGRDIDVLGWIGADHFLAITGFSDWDTLAAMPTIPEASDGVTAGTGADPAGSDLWIAEVTGVGSATMRWSDLPGRWSLLAAGVGEDAAMPTIELTWPREVTTPWKGPGIVVGALLTLSGLAVLLVQIAPSLLKRFRSGDPAVSETDNQPSLDTDTTESGSYPTVALDDASTTFGTAAPRWASLRSDSKLSTDALDVEDDASVDTTDATEVLVTTEATEPIAFAIAAEPTDTPDDIETVDVESTEPRPEPTYASRRERRLATQAIAQVLPDKIKRRGRSTAASETDVEPAVEPAIAPSAYPASEAMGDKAGEVTSASDTRLPTSALPLMTRRELRAAELARRAAQQQDVVDSPQVSTGQNPVSEPAETLTAARSQAWRQAWGFTLDTSPEQTHDFDDQEGGA